MKNIIISVALFLGLLCSPAAFAAVDVITVYDGSPLSYAGHPVSDLELLSPPESREMASVAAAEASYSHLPEPHMASMLLLGIVLIGLSVREEKDEKFSN